MALDVDEHRARRVVGLAREGQRPLARRPRSDRRRPAAQRRAPQRHVQAEVEQGDHVGRASRRRRSRGGRRTRPRLDRSTTRRCAPAAPPRGRRRSRRRRPSRWRRARRSSASAGDHSATRRRRRRGRRGAVVAAPARRRATGGRGPRGVSRRRATRRPPRRPGRARVSGAAASVSSSASATSPPTERRGATTTAARREPARRGERYVGRAQASAALRGTRPAPGHASPAAVAGRGPSAAGRPRSGRRRPARSGRAASRCARPRRRAPARAVASALRRPAPTRPALAAASAPRRAGREGDARRRQASPGVEVRPGPPPICRCHAAGAAAPRADDQSRARAHRRTRQRPRPVASSTSTRLERPRRAPRQPSTGGFVRPRQRGDVELRPATAAISARDIDHRRGARAGGRSRRARHRPIRLAAGRPAWRAGSSRRRMPPLARGSRTRPASVGRRPCAASGAATRSVLKARPGRRGRRPSRRSSASISALRRRDLVGRAQRTAAARRRTDRAPGRTAAQRGSASARRTSSARAGRPAAGHVLERRVRPARTRGRAHGIRRPARSWAAARGGRPASAPSCDGRRWLTSTVGHAAQEPFERPRSTAGRAPSTCSSALRPSSTVPPGRRHAARELCRERRCRSPGSPGRRATRRRARRRLRRPCSSRASAARGPRTLRGGGQAARRAPTADAAEQVDRRGRAPPARGVSADGRSRARHRGAPSRARRRQRHRASPSSASRRSGSRCAAWPAARSPPAAASTRPPGDLAGLLRVSGQRGGRRRGPASAACFLARARRRVVVEAGESGCRRGQRPTAVEDRRPSSSSGGRSRTSTADRVRQRDPLPRRPRRVASRCPAPTQLVERVARRLARALLRHVGRSQPRPSADRTAACQRRRRQLARARQRASAQPTAIHGGQAADDARLGTSAEPIRRRDPGPTDPDATGTVSDSGREALAPSPLPEESSDRRIASSRPATSPHALRAPDRDGRWGRGTPVTTPPAGCATAWSTARPP